MLKWPSSASNSTVMHSDRKRLDCGHRLFDFLANLQCGRKGRVPQPVMSDHTLLIGVGNRALLQFSHGGESLLYPRLHGREKVVREIHSTQVQRQPKSREFRVPFLETLPKLCFRISHKNGIHLNIGTLQMKSRMLVRNMLPMMA